MIANQIFVKIYSQFRAATFVTFARTQCLKNIFYNFSAESFKIILYKILQQQCFSNISCHYQNVRTKSDNF